MNRRRLRIGTGGRLLVDLWALALAGVLCLPALRRPGLGLSGDLVFSPHQPLTDDTLGLGGRLARAVPLDAVVSLLGDLVGGDVLFRVAVVAGPALAGWGAARLIPEARTPTRVVAATVAIWNPFVVERLALGQWALLLAYGCLVHLVAIGLRIRPTDGSARLVRLLPWVALASLTPTGGVLAVLTCVVLPRVGWRPRLALLGAGAAFQLPWLLPSLLAGSATLSDPAGVAAFASRSDAPGGVVVSLLGLGGVWDGDSVPTSRGTFLGVLAALAVVAVLVLAVPLLSAAQRRLVPLALGGLVLALAGSVPVGSDVVRFLVRTVPGGGLLRDGQKWLLLLVLLVVLCVAVLVERAATALAERETGTQGILLGAVLLPLVLLPDATAATWPTVEPVRYPADFSAVRRDLAAAGDVGLLTTAPWRGYRRFDWGNDRTAFDPASAWFDVPVVGSDDRVVGSRTIRGEDRTAVRVHAALDAADPASALARAGVRWVLVYTDDPDTPYLRLDGLDVVHDGADLRLLRVPGAVAEPDRASSGVRLLVVVVVVDLAVALLALLSALWPVTRRLFGRVALSLARPSAGRQEGGTS
ncbi:MAG: hypothetical protein JWO46_2462 [Nocardioidaceae bacterium]|nr:hypothetical protein [Nocardioidaceae bacterium]